jgi:hypothetical protein
MTIGNNVPRSNADRVFKEVGQTTSNRPNMIDHISYGRIKEIDYTKYWVQVKLEEDPGNYVLGDSYWPLITRIDEIQFKYGQLRKNMYVRVFWRGRQKAMFATVEIIGDENFDLFQQIDRPNEVQTGPYKLFSGGLLG